MATLKFRDKDGTWKYAPSLKYKNGNNVFEITNGLKYKDEQGVWHKVNICGSKYDNGDYPTISTLAVGSSVYLNENGSPAEYLMVHKGLPSNLYDTSCDGVWLLRKDIYNTQKWSSGDINNYQSSNIHSYLNNTFLKLFDSKTQLVIQQIKIPHVNGTSNAAIATGSNGLSTKVFLLSGVEVGYPAIVNGTTPIDGSCLDLFQGTGNNVRVAYQNGVVCSWWLRSAYRADSANVLRVAEDGTCSTAWGSKLYGVRPCVILPYTTKLDSNNTIVG